MDTSYSAVIYAVAQRSAGGRGMLQEKLGGKAVLNHSLDAFEEDPACTEMLVFVDAGTNEWIKGNPLEFASVKMRVLPAAATRAETMQSGAEAAKQSLLVLHDACRPNFGADLFRRVLATAKSGLGAVPVVVVDGALARATPLEGVKSGDAGDSWLGPKADFRIGMLAEMLSAALTYVVQTPQAYARADYLSALKAAGANLAGVTDDCALCQAAGIPVALVRGRLENLRLDGEDQLHILQKLMGTGPKKKEKYTGLGW
jgi:2-C-methyl-D-erythritol 4-phosphate cytidylyltransferase